VMDSEGWIVKGARLKDSLQVAIPEGFRRAGETIYDGLLIKR